jgi:hypothetical protein
VRPGLGCGRGAEIAVAEPIRAATEATSTCPALTPVGVAMLSVCDGAVVAALVAETNAGVAAVAVPQLSPTNTAADVARSRRATAAAR